jgi:hypothetical protein
MISCEEIKAAEAAAVFGLTGAARRAAQKASSRFSLINSVPGASRVKGKVMYLYYVTPSGVPVTADLSIIVDGIHIERDVLGNMDITGPGTGIHRVNPSLFAVGIEADASDAGAYWYADDEESATWWIDYVEGYNDTLANIAEIKDALADLNEDQLLAVAEDIGVNINYAGRFGGLAAGIIEWLRNYGYSSVEYEAERGEFVVCADALINAIDKVAV